MSEISGAAALLTALEREKVEYIFGLPGGANLPIYDALVDSKIRHILVRHEQVCRAYGRWICKDKKKGRCLFCYIRSRSH